MDDSAVVEGTYEGKRIITDIFIASGGRFTKHNPVGRYGVSEGKLKNTRFIAGI
jgi:hypothetical protein